MENQNVNKNGCFNRPPMKGYYLARNGYTSEIAQYHPIVINSVPVEVQIKHTMSTDCRHQSDLDVRCDGCIHQKPPSSVVAI